MKQTADPVGRARRPATVSLGLTALVLLLAVAAPARAQSSDDDDDRWAAAAELTFTDAGGNQDLTVFTTGFTLRHLRVELFAFELKLEARYGSSGDERVSETYRGSINVDIGPQRRWTPFIYSRAERDPFRRLDARVSSGAGGKYRLYRGEKIGDASVSMALLHSYEAVAGTDSPAEVQQTARWSLQFDGRRILNDGVTLSHQALYQPIYDRPDDYLLTLDTGVKVLVTQRIALSITHEYSRDSTPAPGVGSDDRLLKAGIIVEL